MAGSAWSRGARTWRAHGWAPQPGCTLPGNSPRRSARYQRRPPPARLEGLPGGELQGECLASCQGDEAGRHHGQSPFKYATAQPATDQRERGSSRCRTSCRSAAARSAVGQERRVTHPPCILTGGCGPSTVLQGRHGAFSMTVRCRVLAPRMTVSSASRPAERPTSSDAPSTP